MLSKPVNNSTKKENLYKPIISADAKRVKETMYLFAVTSHPILTPKLQGTMAYFLPVQCAYSRHFTYMRSINMGCFVTGFIHLIMFSRISHVVAYVSFSFLLMTNNTPLYESTSFHLSIHRLMVIEVLSLLANY